MRDRADASAELVKQCADTEEADQSRPETLRKEFRLRFEFFANGSIGMLRLTAYREPPLH